MPGYEYILLEHFCQRAEDKFSDEKFKEALEYLSSIIRNKESKEDNEKYEEMLQKYGKLRMSIQDYKETFIHSDKARLL
jgi:predicted metal-dependent hydrolase